MAPDQHWCLACGTAAPGELEERPGWRAARTVIALTLLLVLGAVGAGYAALKNGGSSTTPAPSAVAGVPSSAQPAPTSSTPAPTTSTPATPPAGTTSTSTLPKVTTPSTAAPRSAPVHPVTPAPATSIPTTPTPAASPPIASTPVHPVTPTTPAPQTNTPKKTTPAVPVARPIDLAAGAGSAYDPYKQIVDQSDASRALDGNAGTSWAVLPKTAATPNLGYVVNVGKLQGIREIDLQTSTPGFRVEIYATDVATPPADVTDARWAHITTRDNVAGRSGADGKERIVLGLGSTMYRNVLLWITKGPASGDRIKIVDLKLLG